MAIDVMRTNKGRFRLMLIALGIAPMLIYYIAVADTVEAYYDCVRLEEELIAAEKLDDDIAQTRNELSIIKAQIGTEANETGAFQTLLLGSVSEECKVNGVSLLDFPKPHTVIDAGLTIETLPVVISGGFSPTVKTIVALEFGRGVGRLISVSMRKEVDRTTKRSDLRTTLVIQNVISPK